MSRPRHRQRIVIVGAGFAGFHAARSLARLARHTAGVEVVLVNPTDYFLYLALLPEVAGGVLDPRRVAVPLQSALPGVRVLLGTADQVDLHTRQVGLVDPEGSSRTVAYDRLLLAAGSVNRLLPIPGVAEHAHGFRSIAEALYLRDHLLRQLELADAADTPAERDARLTFVVVGAGYTGTEAAAHGHLLTRHAAHQHPGLRGQPIRWLLLDHAPRVLPELDPRLSVAAQRILTGRGVEVRTGTSVEEATSQGVRLSTGEFVPTRSLIWCVGVRPDPLVERLGLPTTRGRLIVDKYLAVPSHPEVVACGDLAAVPDLTRPGQLAPMTAQHAVRQGRLAARNLAASLGHGRRRAYRHHDLGFVVDLGGAKAAANPLGVPLSGVAAKAVTRGYLLAAIPRTPHTGEAMSRCTRSHIVVTGASSGIGRATALRLAAAGHHVYAGVRRPTDAPAAPSADSGKITPLPLDVTDPAQVTAAVDTVAGHTGTAGLDGLVNNAGIGVFGPLEIIPIEQFQRLLEVNVTGQLAVTQAFLPLLRRARGRIVLIGSIGSRFTPPFVGALAASKSALATMGEALRQELAPWGIRVALIEPASVRTEAVSKLQRDAQQLMRQATPTGRALYQDAFGRLVATFAAQHEEGSPPEVAAEAVAHALTAPAPLAHYLVGRGSRRMAILAAVLPTPVLDTLRRRQAHQPGPGSRVPPAPAAQAAVSARTGNADLGEGAVR